MIGGGASFSLHLRDRHLAFFGKQFRQMALVTRIEVLNQHECHAGIVRQMVEQCCERLQTAGGGPYPYDGENVRFNARRLGGHCGNGCQTGGIGALSGGRSALWAGRRRRTPGARHLAERTIAGLLSHAPPLPFPLERTSLCSPELQRDPHCTHSATPRHRQGASEPASRSLMILPISMN